MNSPRPFEIGALLRLKEDPDVKVVLLEYLADDLLYVDFVEGNEGQGLVALDEVEAVPEPGPQENPIPPEGTSLS